MRAWFGLWLASGCLAAPPSSSADATQSFLAEPVRLTLAGEDAWTELDASAQIPAGATGVLLAVENPVTANNRIGLRKRGSADDRTRFGGYQNFHAGYVGVDGDRVFEYFVDDADVQALWLIGYTAGEAVFFDDGVEVSATTALSWQDVDVSALPGCEDAIGAYVEHVSETPSPGWGLRMGGSSEERVPALADPRHGWALVGVDQAGSFQQYVESEDLDLWVVGCQLAGAVFHTSAIDRTPAAEDAWTDLPALPADAIGAVYEVTIKTTAQCDFGVRRNGSSTDLQGTGRQGGHVFAVTGVDDGGLAEGLRAGSTCELWEVGYFIGDR